MAASDNGATGRKGSGSGEQQKNVVSPGRTLGGRSASPAKRRAADMERGVGSLQRSAGTSALTNEAAASSTAMDLDTDAEHPSPPSNVGETQESTASTTATSVDGSVSANSSATSLGSDHSAAHSEAEGTEKKRRDYTTVEIDEQVAEVMRMSAKPLEEGDWGVCVSRSWITRVLARTSEGLANKEFPREAREGPVGPLDNSDIVPTGAFDEPLLHDAYDKPFIPLKPGLDMETDLLVVPHAAFSEIVANYGNTIGQKHPIIRYAHDTAEEGANTTNVVYELYPPTITIRKVTQASNESQQVKPKTSLEALKAKRAQAKCGQKSPDDALRLVSSRAERYQEFLRRAKAAAGIPLACKVKVWRLVDASSVAVDKPDATQSGVLSPPASREASPSKASNSSLLISPETFKKMEVGKDLEPLDSSFQDQTNNSNYNGRSNMNTAGFFEDKTILLEEQIGGPAGGEFQSDSKKGASKFSGGLVASRPGSTTASGRTSPAPSGVMTRGRTRKDGRTRGATGLMNLGNTCYMNSALQCIRSVEELAVYFLSRKYKEEINDDNPLGYHGAMANAYAGVLRGIYEANSSSAFSPNEFKRTLGRHQPLFSGYGQQDSQEFLSFLVDALHEDLNRIKKKPYIENPDSDDSKVHDPAYIAALGETYRNNHKQRNDSIAMDLFSGHYKNKMECPECNKVSVTFDPYSLVTVQLPMEITWQHPITYIPLHGKPVLHYVDVDKNASIKVLKEILAKKHPGADANRMWMIESYASRIYKVFDDQSSVAEANIQSGDYIFVYELEQVPANSAKKTYDYLSKANDMPTDGMDAEQADVFTVPILSRSMGKNSSSYSVTDHPLYITVNKEEAKNYDVILKKVLIAIANTTSRPILRDFAKDESLLDCSDSPDQDKDTIATEDTAGVSDHSAQSEDGYVKVSVGSRMQDTEMTDGDQSDHAIPEDQTFVPADFMDPQYHLSPTLRTQLFHMRYHEAEYGMQFSMSTTGLKEMSIHDMFERVQKSSRRLSVQSSGSDESSTSTASGDRTSVDDDSDAVDLGDKPDIVLGRQEPLEATVDERGNELADHSPTIMEPSEVTTVSRANRRKNKKRRGKGRGGNQNGFMKTSKRDQRSARQLQQQHHQQRPLYSDKRPLGSSDSPYYIELGEAIILDWHPAAQNSLFHGDPEAADDMRGHRYCDEKGRNAAVFPDPEQDAKRSRRELRKRHGVALDDCFDVTSQPEILSEDNAWYCNRCKELRRATKTLEIWTLPDILVVHLKRFGGNRSFRDKVDLKVDYPIEGLDMTTRVGSKEPDKDYIYDLFAVDNHYGGLGGGHYTAMAKNFNDGEWYNYNDASVSPITKTESILSSAAYLLFYRRRSNNPLGPQVLQDLVHEYRNPVASEDADEDESGEGRLGAAHSGLGSSSVLVGAGHGAKTSQKCLAENGGAGVGPQATQRIRMSDGDHSNGLVDQGLTSLHQNSWSFANLNDNEGSNALSKGVSPDEDSSSMAAEADCDSGIDDTIDPPSYVSVTGSPAMAETKFIHFKSDADNVEDDPADEITLDESDPDDLYQ